MVSLRASGCLLGLALGDALGAPHEGGLLERLTWRLVGRTRDGRPRFTDDTQMAIDLAESLLANGRLDADDFARRLAASHRWSRGYGPGMTRVLRRIRRGERWQTASRAVRAAGSFGNGAATRSPVVAVWAAADPTEVAPLARASAEVTHGHALGIEGAVVVAVATHALLAGARGVDAIAVAAEACTADELRVQLAHLADLARRDAEITPTELVARFGNGMTAQTSVATALHIAVRHLDRSFEELAAFAIRCGGDVDTIAAMAGAMWGAANGAAQLPSIAIEQRERIEAIAAALADRGGK